MLYEICLFTRLGVKCVCVGHVANLCRNDASHKNLWDAWFSNCPTYFRHSENDDRSMLSDICLCVSSIRYFGSVTLLFSDTLMSDVWSENSRVMLPKSWTDDTQDRHQIIRNGCYSYVGLGHILPNRVLTCLLSSLT
jgi:hypothetical protein